MLNKYDCIPSGDTWSIGGGTLGWLLLFMHAPNRLPCRTPRHEGLIDSARESLLPKLGRNNMLNETGDISNYYPMRSSSLS